MALIAEKLFRAGIDQHDLSASVDNHHGIRRGFQQRTKLVLFRLPRAHISNRADHHVAVRRLYRTQADLDRKLSAVSAQAS